MKVIALQNNQYNIYHNNKQYFQSYESLIAIFDEENNILLIRDEYFMYSRTTTKYFNIWLKDVVGLGITAQYIASRTSKEFDEIDIYGYDVIHIKVVDWL